MGIFEKKEEQATTTDAPEVEETKQAEAPKEKPQRASSKLDEKKIEEDKTNNAHFMVDEEVTIKDLPFKVKEVKGLELILIRTDIK